MDGASKGSSVFEELQNLEERIDVLQKTTIDVVQRLDPIALPPRPPDPERIDKGLVDVKTARPHGQVVERIISSSHRVNDAVKGLKGILDRLEL